MPDLILKVPFFGTAKNKKRALLYEVPANDFLFSIQR